MTRTEWSLRRRATWQYAVTASTFLAVVGLVVMFAYRVVLADELDEEALEQITELESRYRASAGGAEEFARLAEPTQEDAETPMAWKVVDAEDRTWGPHGAEHLVPDLAETSSAGNVRRLRGDVRLVRGELAPGLDLVLALDGSAWMARFDRFAWVCASIVAVGSMLSILAGRAFASRIAQQLESIATQIADRASRQRGVRATIDGAPQEIRAVAEAVEATLRATEAEVDRARLVLAGVAHDLRAPVQSLLTSTQVALLASETPETVRALFQEHLGELRTLARTIDNLVAWGAPQIAAGGDALVDFDAGTELEDRLLTEEAEAARRAVLVDVQLEGVLTLHGDPGLFVLAIRNLVGNAIAWSPAGGEVLVHLRGLDAEIVVSVEDQGPGVPRVERERIFQPFVRGAAAPGRRSGYGLGLAIVARTVERHRGSVILEDSPTGGARFVLRLPRK